MISKNIYNLFKSPERIIARNEWYQKNIYSSLKSPERIRGVVATHTLNDAKTHRSDHYKWIKDLQIKTILIMRPSKQCKWRIFHLDKSLDIVIVGHLFQIFVQDKFFKVSFCTIFAKSHCGSFLFKNFSGNVHCGLFNSNFAYCGSI